MRRPALLLAGAAALTAAPLAACGGGDRYELVVEVPRAVSLYEGSNVLVMGLPVGEVSEVAIDGDHVRVVLAIDEAVPVPADVQASVVPRSFIGERTVVLFPPWQEGQARAADGDEIPPERVELPIEVDDALAAVDDLVATLDEQAVAGLVTDAAAALDGRGAAFNDAVGQLAGLTDLLAREDDTVVAITDHFGQLAGALNGQGEALGAVVEGFAAATGVLAEERADLELLLRSLNGLSASAGALVDAHEGHLQTDLARLARVALALQTNADSFVDGVAGAGALQSGLAATFQPETGQINIRVSLTAPSIAVLGPLYRALGVDLGTCFAGTPGATCADGGTTAGGAP